MQINPQTTKVGFIGTGVMGKSMAGHILDAGYNLFVYNRTKSKAEELLNKGAVFLPIDELARTCDLVITMVGFPKDVEEVYLGNNGLLKNARENSILIDMTTSPPSLAVKIDIEAKKKGVYFLDAPVSGGDIGAKNATLSIMVGGSEEIFNIVLPIFNLLGKNIVYQGSAGSGQHTKMCNQIVIATGMIGVAESLYYAIKSGLDPEKVLKSIGGGAAGSWSLVNLGPKMLKGDFAPGFYVKHFIKDMKIALDEAIKMGLKLPGLELALSLYEELSKMGEDNSGTQAIFKLYMK
ncbi:2-hydroxy-3-oxopropionate reductase [Thermodesulfobium narugense DSM 14796]|uniref:2-hydroxy-3-oxopropionate reductase n=1 Tax=Thermodesulfobium narugense DSM 14796 TaxID=747365 RepID=M1E5D0_9BACT|nr:NAD(P)-dependent oxidoreductase [Thermodesulfobium narugense]AEE15002.1 2-hydroxy-3-oxopropionate reductase [Thermodesulfobium narugense DSM 14796]